MFLAKVDHASHAAHLRIVLRSTHLIRNEEINVLEIEKEKILIYYDITSNTSDIKSGYFDNGINTMDKYICNNNIKLKNDSYGELPTISPERVSTISN